MIKLYEFPQSGNCHKVGLCFPASSGMPRGNANRRHSWPCIRSARCRCWRTLDTPCAKARPYWFFWPGQVDGRSAGARHRVIPVVHRRSRDCPWPRRGSPASEVRQAAGLRYGVRRRRRAQEHRRNSSAGAGVAGAGPREQRRHRLLSQPGPGLGRRHRTRAVPAMLNRFTRIRKLPGYVAIPGT